MSEYIATEFDLASTEFLSEYEEIVRCRDCEYADETESGSLHCNGYLVADWDYYNDEPSDGMEVKPDGFCAWGKLRGEGE